MYLSSMPILLFFVPLSLSLSLFLSFRQAADLPTSFVVVG